MLRCLDLGPVLLERDAQPVAVPGAHLTVLLSALVSAHPRPIPRSQLIDVIWGESAAAGAGAALSTLVWRLRRVLAGTGGSTEILGHDSRGYFLVPASLVADSHRLDALAAQVADAAGSHDHARVLALTDQVLELWRGVPYEGITDSGWLEPVRGRLVEVYLAVRQHRLAALLASGRPDEVVTEVQPLLHEHPLREAFWASQILALYHSGRQSAALEAYARARSILSDQVGVDPGPELQQLHRRVLQQDPTLEPVQRPNRTDAELRSMRPPAVRLPLHRTRLIGRSEQRDLLVELLATARLASVVGPFGSGKTRLAIEAAESAAENFPDGVWFVDLSQATSADQVVAAVAAALGVAGSEAGGTADAVGAFLADRKVLLVLDNCEQVAAGAARVVETLLAFSEKATILATSRHVLGAGEEVLFTVEPLGLPVSATAGALSSSPAVELLLERAQGFLGTPVVLSRASEETRRALYRVCHAVDGLPLGLEIAAAQARSFSWTEIADGLDGNPNAAARLGRGPDRQRSLQAAVEWSHGLATALQQLVHRRVAVLGNSFTLEAALAVTGLEPGAVVDAISGLVHQSLLVARGPLRVDGASTFAQLAAVRAHARSALRDADEAASTADARDRWLLDRVLASPALPGTERRDWYLWLDDHADTLTVTLDEALFGKPKQDQTSASGPTRPDELLMAVTLLRSYWDDRMHVFAGERWARRAAELDGSPFARAAALGTWGAMLACSYDPAGEHHIATAVQTLAELASGREAETAQIVLQLASSAWIGDLYPLAEQAARRAESLLPLTGNENLILLARAITAAAQLLTGQGQAAVVGALTVIEGLRSALSEDNEGARVYAAATLGLAAHAGDPADGLYWTGVALQCHERMGRLDVGDILEQRGNHQAAGGHAVEAVRCYASAAAHQHRIGRSWPRHPGTAERLLDVRSSLPIEAFDAAWAEGTVLLLSEPGSTAPAALAAYGV